MLLVPKTVITFVLYKLQSSYGASQKANEILFSQVYNWHSDSAVFFARKKSNQTLDSVFTKTDSTVDGTNVADSLLVKF
jgi:hypothetical protein